MINSIHLNNKIGVLFFQIVLGVITMGSMFISVTSIRDWWLSKKSAAWPSVSGKIIRSTLNVIKGREVGEFTQYEPLISYSYDIHGCSYTSGRFTFSETIFKSQEAAQAVCDKYSTGASVEVFYDPNNPKRATLKRNAEGNLLSAIATGIASVFCGYCTWLLFGAY